MSSSERRTSTKPASQGPCPPSGGNLCGACGAHDPLLIAIIGPFRQITRCPGRAPGERDYKSGGCTGRAQLAPLLLSQLPVSSAKQKFS